MNVSEMKYPGLLGALSEASDISKELGVSFEEALKISRERSEERLQELSQPESNVIQFRPRGA